MAAAGEAERQLRASDPGLCSPLAGVSYDGWLGELDRYRLVASPTDQVIERFAERYSALDAGERARQRSELTIDDFYTLLTFAQRRVLIALRSGDARANEAVLRDGLRALPAIDCDRVDWRDLSATISLLSWALVRAGLDAAGELRKTAERAEPKTAVLLSKRAQHPRVDLCETVGEQCVITPSGPSLFGDDGEPFDPSIDLVALALGVQRAIETDHRYRIRTITLGSSLPGAWLENPTTAEITSALTTLRACVTLSGQLDPRIADANTQQLTIFLAQSATATDANVIASAAQPTRGHEALGIAAGPVVCVLGARSFVKGVASYERAGALKRFAQPLASAIQAPQEPC